MKTWQKQQAHFNYGGDDHQNVFTDTSEWPPYYEWRITMNSVKPNTSAGQSKQQKDPKCMTRDEPVWSIVGPFENESFENSRPMEALCKKFGLSKEDAREMYVSNSEEFGKQFEPIATPKQIANKELRDKVKRKNEQRNQIEAVAEANQSNIENRMRKKKRKNEEDEEEEEDDSD